MISCIFLLFIIIVSLLFSHFIFAYYIESFNTKTDTKEDTLLNPEKANGPASAPASSPASDTIPSGYGMLKESFETKKSSEGVFDHLFQKKESSQFTLPKI